MSGPRKPVVNTSGLPPQQARALEPIKQTLEMLTGARNGLQELKGLREDATLTDVIKKVNSIMERLNASGRC